MRWHNRLAVMLRGWFGSSALDRDLNEELRFHFDRQVQANLDAGMPLDQARRSASLLIGNVEPVREASRDLRSGAIVRQIGRDLSYGIRLLRKAPGFSAASIAIIALGVGAVTAIFSVVYGVALKPLPFREPDRLVNLWTLAPKFGSGHYLVNAADHRDWLADNHVFEDIAVFRTVGSYNLVGSGEPERLLAGRVSPNLFSVLGVTPALGRPFTAQEDQIGHEQVVLLSDTFWRRRFNADPSIIGRELNFSGTPFTVVGVMAPDFQYPGREFQVWVPLTINPAELTRKEPGNNFRAVARLKPGVSLAMAQAEMDTIAARLASTYETNVGMQVLVVPTHTDLIADVQTALYVMLGAVVCLLLIAVLNLSTLLSARAAARSRELAVRLALGASRGRVALQVIAEIIPLLAIGGALGVVIAVYAVSLFVPLAPPGLPRVENIEVSSTVLVASIAVLAFTGLLASLLPASQAWRSDLTSATREGSRSSAGSVRQSRARSVLVVTQIALALPLLAGGMLLARTFNSLASTDPGFRSDNVLSLQMAIPRSKYRNDAQVARIVGSIVDRVSAVPGVESAGAVNRLPLSGGAQILMLDFDAPGKIDPALTTIDSRTVTAGYFRTMGIPVIEGRAFDSRDTDSAPLVGIVDDRVAKQIWPNESAVGKRFRIPAVLNNGVPMPWITIVGVVGHVKHDGVDVDSRTQVYWNSEQRAQDRMVLVVRAQSNVKALTPAIIQAVHDVDPEQPVYDVRTMNDVVERSLGQRWLNMTLIGSFASVALVLCSIGLYGVMAFGVARQRREFGIRLAIGASRGAILGGVLGRGLALAGVGTTIGLLIAAVLTRGMGSLLYGVKVYDSLSFGIATAAILLVAVLASYIPARSAAGVDPATTLRAE